MGDRETKGGGEGFDGADSANGGRNWLVQSGESEHCRLTQFDVDVIDAVRR